jgi:hypothetical protein
VLQYQETVGLITALCYEEGKNYLDTETGNIGIVGHVEASTEEVSTVTRRAYSWSHVEGVHILFPYSKRCIYAYHRMMYEHAYKCWSKPALALAIKVSLVKAIVKLGT